MPSAEPTIALLLTEQSYHLSTVLHYLESHAHARFVQIVQRKIRELAAGSQSRSDCECAGDAGG